MLLVPGKALRQHDGWAISSLQHIGPNALETWLGGTRSGTGVERSLTLKLLAWMWHGGQGRKMQPSRLNAVLCQNVGMDYGGQLAVSAMQAKPMTSTLVLSPSSSQPCLLVLLSVRCQKSQLPCAWSRLRALILRLAALEP